MRPLSIKTLRQGALLAQWRASAVDKPTIKAARLRRRVEDVEPLIRRFVKESELRTIQARGCVHSVDFPEKRNRALRRDEGG